MRTNEQLTKEQAISFYNNKLYENMTYEEIAKFQISQKLLCVPFGIFHEAVEKYLSYPVFTHELASERIYNAVLGIKEV